MSVNSVLGKIPVSSLGKTLTHEHFNLKFEKFFCPPPEELAEYLKGNITLSNTGFIKQYPYSSKVNLDFFGEEVDKAVLHDVLLYKKVGGGTIVENTSIGLHRNIPLMIDISKKTKVNIICGTGHYVEAVHNSSTLGKTKESLYNDIKEELVTGCFEEPHARAGFIGEVGSSWPITEFERRCIEATGEVQSEVGCGVSFHPGRHQGAPEEILRLYGEAGGRVHKAIMSHLDRTLLDESQVLEFAELGSYCQFDLFGTECSYYQLNPGKDMLSDGQRIEWIKLLIDGGKVDRILLSHDIHTRHRLTQFGGHGYSHIITNVIPKMIANRNISSDLVETITEKNPAMWLQN